MMVDYVEGNLRCKTLLLALFLSHSATIMIFFWLPGSDDLRGFVTQSALRSRPLEGDKSYVVGWLRTSNAESSAIINTVGCSYETQNYSADDITAKIGHILQSRILDRLAKARAHQRKFEADSAAYFINSSRVDKDNLFLSVTGPDGGLGNLMFFIASLMGVAKTNNRIPVLIRADPRLTYFDSLPLALVNQTLILLNHTLEQSVFPTYPPARYDKSTESLHSTSFVNRTAVLTGYLQSWKYFDGIRDEIRSAFAFREDILLSAKQSILEGLALIMENNTSSFDRFSKVPTLVGVHVRRGDIVNEESQRNHGHLPATDQYLLRMVHRYERKYFPVIFFVISNELAYCREVFREKNFIFLDGNPEMDMAKMTLMDQVIMTVGTYSFWCAYLNEKATDVSYFKDWPKENSEFANLTEKADYFLPTWNGFS